MEQKNRFITANYQLYTVVDGKKELEEQTSEEHPFQFITGFGVSLDAFEQQLINKESGSTFDFTLEPADAFGAYDPEGVHKLGRETFMINGHFDHDNIYEGAIITLMDNEDHRFMAKVLKTPATLFVIPAIIPLVPGGSLFYTMSCAVHGDLENARLYGTRTGECALAIAAGISIVLAFRELRTRRQ